MLCMNAWQMNGRDDANDIKLLCCGLWKTSPSSWLKSWEKDGLLRSAAQRPHGYLWRKDPKGGYVNNKCERRRTVIIMASASGK
ncbi:hypothetical protein HPP92_012211 [Vanilla planifolia]|uniref:Uncharacterized protein n=1 Tax=Vanilla planifolia TaxID=51239 RepID=A0A835RD74_VANPL|nr:hypothetical protein HPP92_012211 [Vanilla planifolia]